MKKKYKIAYIIFLVLLAIFLFSIYKVMYATNVDTKGKKYISIKINSNSNYKSVLKKLDTILINKTFFKILSLLKKYPKLIKTGNYKIYQGMNNNQIINKLRLGKQDYINLVLNNNQTIEDVASNASKYIEPDSADIYKSILDKDFLRSSGFDSQTVKALFISNTYRFFWDISADNFANRMLKEYNKFWNKDRTIKQKKLKLSKIEVITLASIIEKETSKTDEYRTIAGLYINRLKKGWKLESCPTVIFAIKKTQKKDIKRLLYKHLEIDSPYNTYKYSGLPIAPICIPNTLSIDAVLNYQKHNYLYMAASIDRPGYNEFSKSLKEHINKKNKYIQKIHLK